jgi:hypothetical protein
VKPKPFKVKSVKVKPVQIKSRHKNITRLAAPAVGALALALAGCGETERKVPFAGKSSDSQFGDPTAVRLNFSQPRLTPASEGSIDLKVPGFVISREAADYVELIRCRADHELRLADGSLLSNLRTDDPLREDRLKWAWLNAKNDTMNCRIVALNSGRESFVDLAAPAGKWTYHGIGCVDMATLPEQHRGENCNFEIQSTEAFEYNGDLTKRFMEVGQELNMAEGRLAAQLTALKLNAEAIVREKELCEGIAVAQAAMARMREGAMSLLKIGVSVAVSAMTAGTTTVLLNGFLKGADMLFTASKAAQQAAQQAGQQGSTCPAADAAAKKLEAVKSKLATAGEEVMEARNKLAEIESDYKSLPSSIQSEFNRVTGDGGRN